MLLIMRRHIIKLHTDEVFFAQIKWLVVIVGVTLFRSILAWDMLKCIFRISVTKDYEYDGVDVS